MKFHFFKTLYPAMPSKVIFILLLYFSQCKAERLKFKKNYIYVGCFSKRFLDYGQSFKNSLYRLFNTDRVLEECLDWCQAKFHRHSTEKTYDFIAIQYQLCVCIPNYDIEHLKGLIKLPNSECNLTSSEKSLLFGGTHSLAIYAEHWPYTDLIKDHVWMLETPRDTVGVGSQTLQEIGDVSYGDIQDCPSSTCLLRIDIFGIICRNSISSSQDSIQTFKTFLNSYVPGSKKNPALCLDYCNSLRPKPDTSDTGPGKPKLTIQSTINGSPHFDSIELCYCIDKSERIYPLTIEKCTICPPFWWLNETNDICSPVDLQHHVTDISKCLKKCKGKDSYSNKWKACSGETIKGNCASAPTPNQYAYWKCSSDGTFFGEQPDYSNCISRELIDIEKYYLQDPNEIEVLQKLRDLVTTDPKTVESEGAKYYGHDIAKINDIVKKATENPKSDFTERENITTEAVGVLGNLIATSTPWLQLDTEERSSKATDVILSAEQTLFRFANSSMKEILNKSDEEYYEKVVAPINSDPKGFEVTLGIRKKDNNKNIKFPAESNSSHIEILQSGKENEDIVFVGMLVKSNYMQNLTSPNITGSNDGTSSNKTFNGKIISLTLSNSSQMATKHELKVRIQIEHDFKAIGKARMTFRRKLHPGEEAKRILGETECVYWNTTSLVWSTEDCTKDESLSNSQQTICDCNHLTAFAVLTGQHEYIENDKGLEILTLILCPLSIFCLIATVVIFTRMRELHGERTTITKHLCFNLILGNILMLLFLDQRYFLLTEKVCIAVAIATHYIFLCVFGWMAVQGLFLHRMVVVIFNTGKNYMPYYIIGAYCYPLLPIGLTVGIGYGIKDNPYGGVVYCWLNGNYIWAFMGPVAVILIGNFIMTVLALKKVRQMHTSKLGIHKQIKSNWKWIQGCFTLSALLGLTWVTGFFTLVDEEFSHLMSYVFTVANASQGVFILIFYCLLQERVKPLILDKMGKFGLLLSKDNKLQSEEFKKQTNSTRVHDSEPKQCQENRSQRAAPVPMEEEASHNENSQESSKLAEIDDEEDEWQQEHHSGKRMLSVVLESISESESKDESGRLCEYIPQQSKNASSNSILEQRESEENFSEDEGSDRFDEEDPSIRRRRYLCPPYIEELVGSDLYLQMSKSDAERSLKE